MAKQKIPTQEMTQEEGVGTFQESSQEQTPEQKTEQQAPVQSGESDVESAGADTQVDAPKPKQETSPSNEKREKKHDVEKLDSYTDNLLKAFSNYESIYIDRNGGVFAPGTPVTIRKSAKLFTNPYYKS